MRKSDIQMAGGTSNFSDQMYLPANPLCPRKVEEMTEEELRRGLCQKSRGDARNCMSCPGGCRWGKELARRTAGGEKENAEK